MIFSASDFTPRFGKKFIVDFLNGTWCYPADFENHDSDDFLMRWVDESMTDQQIGDYVRSVYLDDISN